MGIKRVCSRYNKPIHIQVTIEEREEGYKEIAEEKFKEIWGQFQKAKNPQVSYEIEIQRRQDVKKRKLERVLKACFQNDDKWATLQYRK